LVDPISLKGFDHFFCHPPNLSHYLQGLYIPGGAGYQPSTVVLVSKKIQILQLHVLLRICHGTFPEVPRKEEGEGQKHEPLMASLCPTNTAGNPLFATYQYI